MKKVYLGVLVALAAALLMGADGEGGVAGGGGCNSDKSRLASDDTDNAPAPTDAGIISCPQPEDIVCDVCEECPSPVDCPVCEDPEDPAIDAPDCDTGWVCTLKEYKDKTRLFCWCGKKGKDHDEDC